MSIPSHISGLPVHGVMLREGDRLLFVRADKPVNDGDYPAVYVQAGDGWIIPVTMEPRQQDMDEALLTIAESEVIRQQIVNVHAHHEKSEAASREHVASLTGIIQGLSESLDLLLIQTRRGVSLPDNPDRLCAIDNQTIERAEKALAGAKMAQQVAA